MTAEFNLSDKIYINRFKSYPKIDFLDSEDVKEFIKKLKEKIKEEYEKTDGDLFMPSEIYEIIEELAGDKLI